MQQAVDQNRATGALPEHVPGRRQLPAQRLLQYAIKHFLVTQKTVDTGPFATGQAMPRQIERQHRVMLLQCPLNQMAVKPHVIVVAMQDQQGAARHRRLPYLSGHAEAIDIDSAQVLFSPVTKIDAVIASVTAGRLVRRQPRVKCREAFSEG